MQNSAKKDLLEEIKNSNSFSEAAEIVRHEINFTWKEFDITSGLSTSTIKKILNHYELNTGRIVVFKFVVSLFCKIEISEALLNKAGICWTNTPVSNTFEEILIYISNNIPEDECFLLDEEKRFMLLEKANDFIIDSIDDEMLVDKCIIKYTK